METQDRFPVLQVGVLLLSLALLLLLLLRPMTTIPIGITRENVGGIEQVARLGDGQVYVAAWSPDARTIALIGSVGVWLYNAEQSQVTPILIEDQAGTAFDATFHPNGRLLAVSNDDGTIYLWDTRTQTIVSRLEGHEHGAANILFTPDGYYLVSTDTTRENATTRLWDIESGEQVFMLNHEEEVEGLAISADSRLLAIRHRNMIQIWRLPDGDLLTMLEPSWRYSGSRMAFSEDGSLFAVSAGNPAVPLEGNVWQIDPDDGFTPLDPAPNLSAAMTIYLESNGELFVEQRPILPATTLAEVWNLQQRSTMVEWRVSTMQPDPTGRFVLLKRFDQVELWRSDGPALITTLHRDIEALYQVDVVGEAVIASSSYSAQIWDSASNDYTTLDLQAAGGALVRTFELNGKLLGFFVDWTGGVRLINLTTGSVEQTFVGITIHETHVFSRDNRYLATNTQDRLTAIWNLDTGQIISQFAPDNRDLMYRALAFSPDASLLATTIFDPDCDCSRVMLWETATGELVSELGRFERYAYTARFTASGDWLIVGGGGHTEERLGGSIKIWDVNTGEEITWLDGPLLSVMALNISPDGQLVVGAGYDNMWMWDFNAPQEQSVQLELTSRGGLDESYVSTTFNPRGDLLVVGTSWGNILFFDTVTGEQAHAIQAHPGRVEDLVFADSGRMLLSTGGDGTVRLWRTDGRQVVRVAPEEPVVLPTIAVTMTLTPTPQPTITTTPVPIFGS